MRKYLFLLAAAFAAFACTSKVEEPSAEEFAPYIKAFTGGIVSPGTPIRVELAEDATAQPAEGIFTLKPAIKGTVKWDGPQSVSFIPEEGALKEGLVYRVTFGLGKVLEGAPDKFVFGITTRGSSAQEADFGEEPDNGRAFRVVKVADKGSLLEVQLNGAPANAAVKGLVEVEGVSRSYVQVQDNAILIHVEGRRENVELRLDRSLKSVEGDMLGEDFVRNFSIQEEKPAVEFPFTGSILPAQQQFILPFRAVNLAAVEVRIVKIYEKNILMYLQDNDLGGDSALRRSGRLIYKADIPLDASKDLHTWNTHSLDLSGLVKKEPGAIYRVRISFRLDQSLYGGKEVLQGLNPVSGKPSKADESVWDQTEPYYWENYYDWDEYNWDESDDPTTPSYYMDSDRFPVVQLLGSDLGLVAEWAGTDKIWVAATDLISAKPVSGAKIEAYDFQLQSVGSGKTDGNGLATINLSHKPFALVAKAGGSTAYLKLSERNERSLSRFDVGGEVLQRGLKSFIYGERGVWRPGDTLHVSAIIMDKGKSLPEGHPATLEVYTPAGSFYAKYTRKGVDGFYSFDVPTKADDPTGYWNAYLKVGGSSFHKVLHIETIKPNRLKINTQYPAVLEGGRSVSLPVEAAWLTGGVAGNLPVNAQITLRKASGAPFKGFEKYSFYAPDNNVGSLEGTLFEGRLDAGGRFAAQVPVPGVNGAPGMLQAFVVTSVQEPGGDESFTTETLLYSPYTTYVGIRVPDGDYLETDKDQVFHLAVVNASGQRIKGHQVEYAVYKTGWSWWWDGSGSDLDAYVNGSSVQRILGGTLVVGAQDASFSFRVEYPDWGRYLVVARDKVSGHIAGATFTVDWPEYRGRANRGDPEALTQITLSTDKPSYQVGEKATVYIPAAPGGRALVSLENAAGVLKREWVSAGKQDTTWSFTVTDEMAPNIYVHVTLLLPYIASEGDLPLRLYGVQRVKVENPASHLNPVIQMPDVIHPEEPFTVKVSEKNGKAMTYTLAIVDEGLLDLTAFKTPDPWSRMYQWEALGVHTWDLYDQVIGAFGGKFSPLAAIGGDQEAVRNARKDNRFNPVVLYCAPKTLKKGTDAIKLQLPMYVGSVRVMLVAGHDGAFGQAEKTVPVQNPLMVVTTLPRVMGSADKTSAAVNVFAMEDGVKEATVTVKADGPLSGGGSQTVQFDGKGDRLVSFPLQATGEGISHVTVTATGGGHKASETVALEVRNANPEITSVERFVLEKGASRNISGNTLQLATFPAVDVRGLFLNMKNYPYNCSEQLSSRGLTLLHLLPLLDEADAAEAKAILPVIISSLYARQNADGGFAYWTGGSSSTWVSSMAGQLLSEADKAGFDVNDGVVKAWKNYQQKMSQVYRIAGSSFFSHTDEAYRLYTLALAGAPYLSGMNRLREAEDIGDQARWMLSAAYAVNGKASLAAALLDNNKREFPEYEPYNITYGTALRDLLVAIDALALNGRVADALALAEDLPERDYSSQESAFAAIALHHLYEKTGDAAIRAKVGGREVGSAHSIVSVPLSGATSVQNTSDGRVYATLLSVSREAVKKAASNGISLQVRYTDEHGAAVNPASLKQGTRIRASIKVTGHAVRSLENLALDMGIPAGWEIVNERLTGAASEDSYDYKDIRDDRVLWYFGLPAGRSKSFSVQLRAAYEGSYSLPATVCQAMYEPAVNACSASGTAVVTR